AAAQAIVGDRPRCRGSPEERVGLGIVAAGEPRAASAVFRIRALPGVISRIALRRYGPMAPDALAGGRFVCRHEAANAPIGAGDSRDHKVLYNQRRDRRSVMLRLFG